jgi:hypothetical protein
VRRVDDAIEVDVRLRIEPGTISGSMRTPSGAPAPFAGWLGLITAVERLQAALDATDRDREENHE